MPPLVSFVVPAFNFEKFIGDCLGSILAQTGTADFEVLVIDDASTDATGAVIKSFDDPRLRLIQHPVNRGNIATINEGLAGAQGVYVARIDGDDRYRADFLEQTLPIFQRCPEVGLIYGDVAAMDETGNILADPWPGIRSRPLHHDQDYMGNEYLAQLQENVIPAATVIARREVWAQALPIPADFSFSDWYLNLRMARHHNFYYRAQTLADYRLHPQNLHRRLRQDRALENTLIQILDQVFSEDKDWPELQRLRREIYGTTYLRLASKYLVAQRRSDTCRSYLRAIAYQPSYLFNARHARLFLAAILGEKIYQRGKIFWHSVSRSYKTHW